MMRGVREYFRIGMDFPFEDQVQELCVSLRVLVNYDHFNDLPKRIVLLEQAIEFLTDSASSESVAATALL
eukprot:8069666-Lingulodinium_polyedra.AAC.1